MALDNIIMDGRTYHVRVVYPSRKREFKLISGRNAGQSLAVREIRDLRGTGYSFSMQVEADPAYPEDYDDFFWSISAPVDAHTVTLPFGQSTMTFEAAVDSGGDTDDGIMSGRRHYSGLVVNFHFIQPQRPI